jgi:C-terminal processing protease CtpA/Prc
MLRAKRASGAYREFASAEAFAEAVTRDLQAVHEDRHLKLHPPRPTSAAGQQVRRGPGPESAITKAGWIADKVAYISFGAFPGNEATLAGLREFLVKHGEAETLIIDARAHRGGGLAEMDLLFPLLFDKEQVLVKMDTRLAVDQRGGNPMAEEWSLRKEQGPETVVRRAHYVTPAKAQSKLKQAKVFLLTSNRTASAGEHLSLSLKRTGRATLIGETTRGAGHYGGGADLGGGFSAFIPVGRTFDPDTGQGWEGVGVKPHVEVPAEQALEEALRRAGVQPGAARDLARL